MTATTKNFNKIDIGPFGDFSKENENSATKKFYKEVLELTGMEFSITAIPSGGAAPFFHSHKQNEELYVVLEGRGQIQLDGELIDIKEGSMINVLPSVSRALRAAKDSQLVYLCVQAKSNSLEQYTKGDGVRHDDDGWKN
ncbi:MAG TPA: cupin domain-containing protein [Planktothrix sp.]|jgi:mannose-6-phosphate isomerase-like protein (cupin superfamily)